MVLPVVSIQVSMSAKAEQPGEAMIKWLWGFFEKKEKPKKYALVQVFEDGSEQQLKTGCDKHQLWREAHAILDDTGSLGQDPRGRRTRIVFDVRELPKEQ